MVEPNVSYEAELIREVRRSKGLTLKEVGLVSGYSTTSIDEYEHGNRTVPIAYIAGLLRATGDFRLVQLVWPSAQVMQCDQHPSPVPPIGDAGKSNAQLLEAIEKLATAARWNQRILADGLVSDSDGDSVINEQHLLNEVASIINRHTRNLMAWYEQATKGSRR